jgi:hypothetical protein
MEAPWVFESITQPQAISPKEMIEKLKKGLINKRRKKYFITIARA